MTAPQAEVGVDPRPTWKHDNGDHVRHELSSTAVVIKMGVSDRYIVLSLDDRTIHVFTAAGEPLAVFRENPQNAWSLAIQDDTLLTGEIGGAIRCWDLEKRELSRSMTGHTGTVRCLKFTGPKTVVSASRDCLLKIWDLETGDCQGTLPGHSDSIFDLAISQQHAISGSLDGTARVWSLPEKRETLKLSGHTAAVYRVDCDGKRIFTGSLDHDVRVWDLRTGDSLAVLKGHESIVSRTCVLADVLVTAGADGNIIIWSLRDYTALHTILKAHDAAVTSLDVRNGHILSGSSDGTVKMWDLKTAVLQGDLGTQTQAVWSVSLGRGEHKTVIVASAQGSSLFPKHDGAFLDIWPLS